MNILVTGGTGFIGSRLCERLLERKATVTVLSRHPNKVKSPLQGIASLSEIADSATFDAVINLAGEPIANKRWSDPQKQKILQSRVDTTSDLIELFKRLEHKPSVFVSGSAIGFYGVGVGSDKVTEEGLNDFSFSSHVCCEWEACALQADTMGIRTCLLRTGIVLGKKGGALAKMLLPFKLGLGGPIGSGEQWMPWIHIEDLVGIILFAIEQHKVSGPINGTSPNPVTNLEFTHVLGRALHRPTLLPMPEAAVKLLMGQMGEELLLAGKRVVPAKALALGYHFQFEHVDTALRDVV